MLIDLALPLLALALTPLISAPLGAFLFWHRLAGMGDTLSHSFAFSVAILFLLNIEGDAGYLIYLFSVFYVYIVYLGMKLSQYTSDVVLASLSQVMTAAAILLFYSLKVSEAEIFSILFGSIYLVQLNQLIILAVLALVLAVYFWKESHFLMLSALAVDIAKSETPFFFLRMTCFYSFLGLGAAALAQVYGSLTATAVLILPALSARLIGTSPRGVILVAISVSWLQLFATFAISWHLDLIFAPLFAVVAFIFFLICLLCKVYISYFRTYRRSKKTYQS